MLLNDIKAAVAATNPAQRNWDRSRDIPKEHMDLFEEIIRLAPTKQNETHYKVFMFKDPTTIREIYDKTNYFGVPPAKEGDDPTAFTNNQGITKDEYNVKNSQVWSNLVIALCEDWDQSRSRTLIHKIVDERKDVNYEAIREKNKIIHVSQGILLGELMLAATLLGYRTGLCSAYGPQDMWDFVEGSECNCLLGIGFPHPDKDRREHEEVYNRDIVAEDRRTGPLDEKWKFPTFEKEVYVKRDDV